MVTLLLCRSFAAMLAGRWCAAGGGGGGSGGSELATQGAAQGAAAQEFPGSLPRLLPHCRPLRSHSPGAPWRWGRKAQPRTSSSPPRGAKASRPHARPPRSPCARKRRISSCSKAAAISASCPPRSPPGKSPCLHRAAAAALAIRLLRAIFIELTSGALLHAKSGGAPLAYMVERPAAAAAQGRRERDSGGRRAP